MEPFQAVEVLVTGDMVAAIKIALAANLEPKQLAKQLSLDEIEPVTVTDEAGEPLGLAFPERGVLFMFTVSEEDAQDATTNDGERRLRRPSRTWRFSRSTRGPLRCGPRITCTDRISRTSAT